MPKMRGFLRSNPKIDEAEWAISQIRTAARLEDLFGEAPDRPSSHEDASSDAAEDGSQAAVSPDPVVVGPWPGGPRPPIIVVGVTKAVEAKSRPVRAKGRWIEAKGGPTDAKGEVTHAQLSSTDVERGPVEVDHGPVEVERGPVEVERGPVDVERGPVDLERGPVEPIGVMARSGDDVGDDTWQLPSVRVLELDLAPPGMASVELEHPVPHPDKAARRSPAVGSATRRADRTSAPAQGSATARPAPARSTARRPPAKRPTRAKVSPAVVPTAHCPYCAMLLEPAPTSSRRCDRCRQRIVVRRVEGGAVYLTQAAVPVFESERRRVASSARLIRERDRWLRLAAASGAPAGRHAQIAVARLTEDVVAAARALYLTTADRAFRAAKRDQEWDEAARIRREEAVVLYRVAGSPLPPPADLVALVREGLAAELRGISAIARNAELVSGRCCDICRADDRQSFRIARELRAPRLPHAGCPKGLCRCHFDLLARDRTTMRRYLRRRPGVETQPGPETRPVAEEPVPTA